MKTMEQFDEIELKLRELLERVVREDNDAGGLATGEWTKRIKLEFSKLGHEKGFSVSASECEGVETGEWLFDLIWCDGERDPWVFLEMPMAMECEWSLNDDEIWWDFEKLLVVRAKYRVFIFNKKSNNEVKRLMDDFRNRIVKFRSVQNGDRYFLAGFSWESAGFNFSLVIV